jgi:hypothetical protein
MYMLIGRSLSDSRKRSEAVTVALGSCRALLESHTWRRLKNGHEVLRGDGVLETEIQRKLFVR